MKYPHILVLLLSVALLPACTGDDPKDSGGAADGGDGADPIDADGDGFTEADDCDDTNAAVNPDAAEVCDGLDNDCDALVDDEDDSIDLNTGTAFFADADEDSFGDAEAELMACALPAGAVENADDCDDADPTVNPASDEVCNGFDDDCDGLTDDEDDSIDPAGQTRVYPDADADGFGDAASAGTLTCAPAAGAPTEATDCDDGAADVNPDAIERCDGVDTDCDPGTSEAGLVTRVAPDGSSVDWTGAFSAGSEASPAPLTLSEGGTYNLCDGTYYANITIEADVVLSGTYGDATLNGGAAESVVSLEGDGLSLELRDITVENGLGARDITDFDYYTSGGGVFCSGSSDLSLDGARFIGNVAEVGAGVATRDCSVSVLNSELSLNIADFGGGLFAQGGVVDITDTAINDNSATGGAVYGFAGAVVALHGVEALRNNGDIAALLVDSAELSCDTSSSGARTVVHNNGLLESFTVVSLLDSDLGAPTLTADDCDFGDWGATDDNAQPNELYLYTSASSYAPPDGATFSCDAEVCGVSETFEIAQPTYPDTGASFAYGEVFLADTAVTLDRFAMHAGPNDGCDLSYAVITNTTSTAAGWTLLWRIDAVGTSAATELHSSPNVGLVVEPGTYYGLLYAWSCSEPTTVSYDTDLSSSEVGFGEAVAAFATEIDTIDDSGAAFTIDFYEPTAMMNMTVTSTEL